MSETNTKRLESIDLAARRVAEARRRRKQICAEDYGDADMNAFYAESQKADNLVRDAEAALWIVLGFPGVGGPDLAPLTGRQSLCRKSTDELERLVREPSTPIDTVNAAADVLRLRQAEAGQPMPTAHACRAAHVLSCEFGVRRLDQTSAIDLAQCIDRSADLPTLIQRRQRLEEIRGRARRLIHQARSALTNSKHPVDTRVATCLTLLNDATFTLDSPVAGKPEGGGE